jgi:hypothetical protein
VKLSPWIAVGLVLVSSGCVNKERWPFLGKWNGGFEAESVNSKVPSDLKRWNMPGYIMLYATRWAFKMHIEAETSTIEAKGIWELRDKTLTLRINDLKIDDRGGEEKRDPNKKYISADAIQKTIGRQIVFRLSDDLKKMDTGLQSFDEVLGSFKFAHSGKAEG